MTSFLVFAAYCFACWGGSFCFFVLYSRRKGRPIDDGEAVILGPLVTMAPLWAPLTPIIIAAAGFGVLLMRFGSKSTLSEAEKMTLIRVYHQ